MAVTETAVPFVPERSESHDIARIIDGLRPWTQAGHLDQVRSSDAFDNVKRAHLDRAKGTHPFVNGFKVNRRRRACGNCGKPSRVFQAAEEIIKKILPKATLFDFLGCGSFHKRPLP